MNQFLAAAAGAITAVGVGAVGFARSWPGPSGRHRAPRTATVTLDDLLGPPPAFADIDFTDVPVAGVLTQAWRPCSGPCGGDMPSVVHADGSHTCGHCFTTTTTTGGQP